MNSTSVRDQSDKADHDFDRERAFLRYRKAIVSEWPDMPIKTATLTAIESRIKRLG